MTTAQNTVTYMESPLTGEMLNLRQMGWNPVNLRDRKYNSWVCKTCGYKWKGHKRVWREHRKPVKCPSCGKYTDGNIVKVRMHTS